MNALSPITRPAPVVIVKDGEVFANSRDVSEYFGKNHADIIRAIDNIAEDGSDWSLSNFAATPYIHPQNGQSYRAYDLTKDGFTELVMGFTGSKARQFKRAYIQRFNEMEAELKSQDATPTKNMLEDPQALRTALLGYTEQVLELEKAVNHQQLQIAYKDNAIAEAHNNLSAAYQQVEAAQPSVDFIEEYVSTEGYTCLSDLAKLFGKGPQKFLRQLGANRILFKRNQKSVWLPYQKYIDNGWFYVKSDLYYWGESKQTLVTTKGIKGLSKMLKDRGII